MRYFTADWHLNEKCAPNTHTFLRPFNFNDKLPDNLIWPDFDDITEFWFLGDMAVDLDGLKYGCEWVDKHIKCPKFFLYGDKELNNKNFTEEEAEEIITEYFDSASLMDYIPFEYDGKLINLYATHLPQDLKHESYNGLVGHIHGTSRVQKTKDGRALINVGIDAWSMQVVSAEKITHQLNAVLKGYYDNNIFLDF